MVVERMEESAKADGLAPVFSGLGLPDAHSAGDWLPRRWSGAVKR